MLRFVFRPLLVLLTLGALVVALLQVGGRVAFTLLDDLEVGVNQLLAGRNAQVSGLRGDWRMLNPIVTADRVVLPAGILRGVHLEVDMVGSVLHGTLVARRLKIDDFDLTLEKPEGAPWRLAGPAGSDPLPDPWPALQRSDQLEVDGRLRLARAGVAEAAIQVSYLGVNRGATRRHRLKLENQPEDCIEVCWLSLDLQARPGLWPIRAGDLGIAVAADGFRLPRALLGISPLQLAHLDATWQRSERRSGGRLALRAEQFDMPGEVSLATSLAGVVRGSDVEQQGALTGWQIERAEEIWRLPDVALRVDSDGVSAWLESLDLSRAGQFLAQALAGLGAAEEWLQALNVRGLATNLRAHVGFDGGNIGYAMRLDGVGLDAHKGVPAVEGAAGELLGTERSLQLVLNAQDLDIAFPDIFTDRWHLPYAQGTLHAWFGGNYFGIRGRGLRAETLETQVRGSFALSRPVDRSGQRLLLTVDTDRIDVATAQRFVPYKLPDGLREWLASAPQGGTLTAASLAMQGQLQNDPGELGRRLELEADVHDAGLRYHPEWPAVTDFSGHLAVAGSEIRVGVDAARSGGAALAGSRLRLLDNASAADVALDAELDADALLTLARTTPLARWLTFVAPDWTASGPMRVSGDLLIPLRDRPDAPQAEGLAVRLRADMDAVDVALPEFRLALEDLDGSWRYRHPFELDASGVNGRLFDQDVVLGARSGDGRVQLLLAGKATPADVWTLLDLDDAGLAEGDFGYEATVALGTLPGVVPEVTVRSDLAGLALALPAGFAKPADVARPTEVRVRFLDAGQRIAFSHRDATGWLAVADRPVAGAIGFTVPPPVAEPDAGADGDADLPDGLVVAGWLSRFDIDELLPEGADAAALPLPIRLADLEVEQIGVGDYQLTHASLAGRLSADGFDVEFAAEEVAGRVSRSGDEPMQVSLAELRIPSGERGADVLEPAIVPRLPAAAVTVERLLLGDEDYGRWRFGLRPDGTRLFLDDFEAEVRGVRIAASAPLLWDAGAGQTQFEGRLEAGDLAEVLPQWGYAPSIETESASLTGAFSWSGSPAAFDLLALEGAAEVQADQGRFLDVESGAGAQRIFSLLNFTAIAKRMSFNFSDVFGRGISFDTMKSRFALEQGTLTFIDPLEVEGTGSRFRVSGSVDLAERRLDNEMLVTLPVSRSLPWYAAYVALANPLAGIGMLVGERVLRKPLEQFSSARYRISGTLDDPQVSFVSVFDVTPAEQAGDVSLEPVTEQPEDSDE
ncbi:MAG: AsmA-like C-terminal region-containing protein [Pseudomonadales bacterium]